MKENHESIDKIKSLFDNISPYFDDWLGTLQEKVYSYVTWEHLKKYLPVNNDSLILDAGGGTGRWAIPLAKMGYRVILCDISEGMLKQATKNINKERLSDRILLKKENLTSLSFSDQTFDFIVCEDGPISISDSHKVVRELVRVLKNNGKIWACVLGRYPLALAKVETNSEEALKLSKSELNYIPYKGLERSRVFSPAELQNLFHQNGIEVIKQYGNRIVTSLLSPETQAMTNYDEKFYSEIKSMELHLSEEPALLGYAEYLQIVGIK